jgi:endoglucanase
MTHRKRIIAAASALATLVTAFLVVPRFVAEAAEPSFNYAEALQKSIFFYEAQQSGDLPSWNRVTWRGDSTLNDGKGTGGAATLNLSGGWYDAGDHVKFGFPMAFTTTMLAWGVVQNRSAYSGVGQLTPMLNNLRYATDYLIAAHPDPNTLYVQVGDAGTDHSYWGPPEMIEMNGIARPVYKITPSCPGTDVAAETAAAMAASSIAFRPTDPAYADTLVTHARQLFTFADATKGTNGQDTAYVNCVKAAQGYYTSTAEGIGITGATKMYWDELAWASVWLYQATNEANFLSRAREFYPKMGTEPDVGGGPAVPVYTFGLGWNDKEYGVYVLMAKLTGDQQFKDDAQRYLDYWSVGYKGKKGTTTPGGLAFIFYWGSLRMAAHTAWAALVYADYLGTANPLYARYHDFAKRQVDYALGANPGNHSYMVGFGVNPPKRVHHRGASGQWLGYMTNDPPDNRHIIYGALAGGPDANDGWVDDRNDFQRNEVAVDYNAGITADLARLAGEFGGTPVADSALIDPVHDQEMLVEQTVYNTGPSGASIAVFITNKSGWPPRVLNAAKARYFFTLDGSTTINQITTSASDANGCAVRSPVLFSGTTYAIDVDCTGKPIFPGNAQLYRRTTQINVQVASPGTWNGANDWSAQSASNIPLYDDSGRLVWGAPPGGGAVDTTPPTTPGTPTASTVTSSSAVVSWTASTDNVGVTGYDVLNASNTVVATSATNSATLTGLTPATQYTVRVQARDAAGNVSTASAAVTFTTANAPPDTQAPTVPGTPTTSNVTSSAVTLSWTASTDNVGVTGYDIFRATGASGGTFASVGTSTSTSFTNTGLTASTTYRYQVRARDAAGNLSAFTPAVSVTTTGTTTGGCTATLALQSGWNNGYVMQPNTVTNTGTSTLASWTVTFTLPAGHTITNFWNATVTVSGQTVTVRSIAGNTLAPNASASWGFQASRPDGNTQVPSGPACTTP